MILCTFVFYIMSCGALAYVLRLPGGAERVNLVNKHDGRLGLPSHLEHLLHELLGLALPLGH